MIKKLFLLIFFQLCCFNINLALATNIPTDGLIGSWELNGNALDSSGNGYDGTVYNVTWENSDGGNKVAKFNGINGNIQLPNISITDKMTFSFLFKGDTIDLNRNRAIFEKTNSYYGGYGFGIQKSTGKLYFVEYSNDFSKISENISDTVIVDNSWKNIIIIKDGNNFNIYINGVLDKNFSLATFTKINGSDVDFSGEWNAGEDYLNGNLGLAKIYNRAISQSEIDLLYKEGKEKLLGEENSSSNTEPSIIYTSPFESNSSSITTQNIPAKETIFASSQQVCSKEKNENYLTSKTETISDAADPVTLSNGEFVYNNTLISNPGTGLPFSFDILYKNQSYYNGPLGNNFDFNYNQFLVEDENGNLNYHNGKLGVFKFEKTTDGFKYNDSIKGELVKQTDETYILTLDKQKKLTFNTDLRLSKIEDNNGNFITFEYNENHQITNITDTLGKVYTFSYYDHSRLQKISESATKYVEFIYFDADETQGSIYDLKTIKIVSGEYSKDISFTYTTSETNDFDEAHNIVKLIDSNGNTYVENAYQNDRVISQKYGNGTVYYTYTLDENEEKVLENSVVNRRGTNTIYYYDENGNTLKRVVKGETEADDITYSFEYDENNKVIKEVYPKGNGITFKYDEKNNLIEKRFKQDLSLDDSEEDLIYTYEYDDVFSFVTKTTYPNGKIENIVYDETGKIIEKNTVIPVESGEDRILKTNFEYDVKGNLIKKTSPEGLVTDYEYLNGFLVKTTKNGATIEEDIINTFEYDDNNNLIKKTDELGNITNMTYNEFNNLIKVISPIGTTQEFEYDLQNNKTKESIILSETESIISNINYDVLDNPVQVINQINATTTKTTSSKYNAEGDVIENMSEGSAKTTYEYDRLGNVLKQIVVVDESDETKNIITTNEYDINGNLTKQIAPNGTSITYIYDGFDRVIKIIDNEGNYKTNTYDKSGLIILEENFDSENNLLSKKENIYDIFGKILKEKNYLLSENISLETEYIYDDFERLIKTINPKNQATQYVYDSFGRLTETIDTLGNKTINTYDKKSQIITKTIKTISGDEIKTTYTYDDEGRVLTETNNKGETVSYTYNNLGKVVSKTDAKGNITSYTYDYRGLVLTETRTVGEEEITKNYTYDLQGNLTQAIDENGNAVNYIYDNLGRITRTTYADDTTTTFEYDKSSNVTKITQPNGTIINNTYDDFNRLIQKDITLGEGVEGITQEIYTYDVLGRLATATDNDGNEISYEYDELNRMISETNGGKTVNYSYDEVNNLISKTSPSGKIFDYTYDELNRLTSIKNGETSILDNTYSDLTKISETLGNNLKTNYSYDELLRLKNINYLDTLDNIISNYNYTYDSNSNILSDGTESYTYDELDQLTQVNYGSGTTESLEYDNVGNRISQTNDEILTNYTTNTLNQITQTQTDTGETLVDNSFVYDILGNLKQDNKQKYFYDYKNRLVRVTNLEENEIAKYAYDVAGRRIKKELANGTIYNYVYSNDNIILETKIQNGLSFDKEYIYTDNIDDVVAVYNDEIDFSDENQEELGFCSRVIIPNQADFEKYNHQTIITRCEELQTQLENATITEKLYYYQKDYLGTPKYLSDETGEIVDTYKTDVYGNITVGEDSQIENNIYFTGREFDRETGLYYYRARYYSPTLGRFISRDPIGIQDGLNIYTYVKNNPLNSVDPMGTEKMIIAWSYSKVDLVPYGYMENNINWTEFEKYNSFARAARTKRQELIKKGVKKENIILKRIDGATELKNAWQEWGKFDKVSSLDIYSHGYKYPEVAGGSENFWGKDTPKLKWAKNAEVAFYGCNTSSGAKEFSSLQKVTTYGQDGYSSFSTSETIHIKIKDKTDTTPVYLYNYEVKNLFNFDGKGKKFISK